jgi:hypothetical protein
MASAGTRWKGGWRRGLALLSHLAEEPAGELLAMIWGPRFDRAQAEALLLAWPRQSTQAWQVLRDAADRYDALAPRQQERLRRRVRDDALRLRAPQPLSDNAACRASC